MSEYQYQFYGRRIIANIPLPATPYTETSGIGYSSAIRVEGVITDREMKDDMTVTENMYCISSPRVSFQIQLNPAHISVYSSGEESIVSTVFNLPFSLLLAHDDDILLHCSCLLYNQEAYAICAEKGTGKSLLAAHLCKRLQFLSDDTLCLRVSGERVRGYGATKHIKLYKDAYKSIKAPSEKFDLYRQNIQDKRYVDVSDIQSTDSNLEGDLKCVYILRRSSDEEAPITIRPVASLFQKRALLFTHLVGASFFPYSLLVRVENSIVVKQILRDIPFYVLTVPTAIHRMEEITEQIYHHICTQ